MEEPKMNSKDIERLIELANTAAEEGDMQSTREYLLEAVNLDPGSVRAWYYLSHCAGSRDQEIQALRKVLELEPDHQKAAKRLAEVENDFN